MNRLRLIYLGFSAIAILITPVACAEDIQTYGGCDICPGQIHYGPEEAREILGSEGLKLVTKLHRNKAVKIDLDKVRENGTEEDSDEGYELVITSGQNVIDVKDIHDNSYVLIVTDHFSARGAETLDGWRPEIYLQARQADRIDREGSLREAWDKFEKSNIYQWVGLKEDEMSWRAVLGNKLLEAITLMGDDE